MIKNINIKFVILFLTVCGLSLPSQGQTKSGLIISTGSGSINVDINPSYLGNTTFSEIDYKSNFSVGYRFRFHSLEISPLFLDLDANLGMKSWQSLYGQSRMEPPAYEASSQYFYFSTSGTANYPIYKGLSIGLGIEPTYYFSQSGESSKNAFDIPVVGKIAYNFKIVEVGFNYKYGLMNVIKTDHIDSGKFRDWQLSVWIPF